jgi:type IV secretory pathway VirB9-like protein
MRLLTSMASLVAVLSLAPRALYAQAKEPASPPTAPEATTAYTRQVHVTRLSVVPLRAHLRFSTVVVLPQSEHIFEALCADADYWQITVSDNIVSIKPAKAAATTNVNVRTTSGNLYTLLLTEMSGQASVTPDLKVYVDPDASMLQASHEQPQYVPATDIAVYRDRATAAQRDTEGRIHDALAAYPQTLHFSYRFDRNRAPFLLDAIWDDGRRTYLRTRATELPALYELTDGQPSLVQVDVQGQTLIVPKVLTAGYLALGNKRTEFTRERP